MARAIRSSKRKLEVAWGPAAGKPVLLSAHVTPPSVDFSTRPTPTEQLLTHQVAAYRVWGSVGWRTMSATSPYTAREITVVHVAPPLIDRSPPWLVPAMSSCGLDGCTARR